MSTNGHTSSRMDAPLAPATNEDATHITETIKNKHQVNGVQVNGVQVNEVQVNGVQVNGVQVNGNHVNGSSTTEACDEGVLLKMVLDLVLRTRLVTGVDVPDKVVEFKQPQELRGLLDLPVGHEGCGEEEVRKVLETVVRYSVKTQHPHFYNQLYGGIDQVALAAAWLTEALNTNQYTYEVAPVFILAEHYIISHLVTLYGWQEGDGIFSPGGSMSNMYGMVLARYRCCPDIKRSGVFTLKPLVAFTSDQGHYSVSKGASWLGLGMDNVVAVASDARGRMVPEALRQAITEARARGAVPFFVNATAGTTVLGAYDPLQAIADICHDEDLWLHVDACWGGSVMLSSTHKHLMEGVNRADSVSWNPHKMLGTTLQCSAFLTRHKGLLHECNSARASYLFQQDKYYDVTYDTGDKSVQCGRKVDAFKLWLFFKVHGRDTLEVMVDSAFLAARHFREEIRRRADRFLLVEEPQCTNICFWFVPPSLRGHPQTPKWWAALAKVAPQLKERMVKEGTLMIGYQPMACKNLVNFLRMVVTCLPTPTTAHMDFVLDELERLGADL